jgi:transcriptional regulator
MYLPDAFAVDDPEELFAHAEAHPFATLITQAGSDVGVSHLPVLVDASRGVLRGHLARANPQAGQLAAGVDVLAIFHGPHGYVSPSAYAGDAPTVPTWNYAVVHAHGRARAADEHELRRILEDSVARFDTTGWRMPEDEEYLRHALDQIMGFEIQIARLEGKWKISQNRSAEDRRGVIDWLAGRDESSRALAALMRLKV